MKKVRINRKKAAALIMAGVMTLSVFSACGSKSTNDTDENGKTVITVGSWPDKEGTELDNMNARKDAFEQANPDVSIKPDPWKFERQTFYAKASGGQLPIVYGAGFTELPEIISSGFAADLSSILSKRGYDGMFNPIVLDVISKDDAIYVMPEGVTLMGLMINTDLFKEAGLLDADGTPKQPETWNDVVDFAVKIKKATGKPGFVIPTAGNSGGWLFTALAWSFGVDFMEKDADGKWKATFNTPEAAEALQFIKDMKWKYDILPSNSLINAEEWRKIFGTGQAGITFGAGDYPANSVAQYGIEPNSIGMVAMPKGPKKHVTLLAGNFSCINSEATEKQIDAGVRWLETKFSHKLTDEFKTNKKADIDLKIKNNQLVGIKGMSVWSNESEALKYEQQLIDENINTNPNHVRLYNEFAANCPCEVRAEEPVSAQQLYATLDRCLQEVMTNENADCAAILEKANSDFQSNYLDNLTY